MIATVASARASADRRLIVAGYAPGAGPTCHTARVPDEPTKDKTDEPQSRLGRFLTKYATLVSSTVLGIAGLAATSIWQFRQAANAQQQAESQQHVAEEQAENSWKIERADILSKNIGTLAASGPNTVEQRYGVLLSLTRGNLLDPELAVSYALELGKDSAEDMASVLTSTDFMYSALCLPSSSAYETASSGSSRLPRVSDSSTP